jgi:hypothetical protein
MEGAELSTFVPGFFVCDMSEILEKSIAIILVYRINKTLPFQGQ